MNYDGTVIVQQASRLYARAGSIMASYTFLGLILGLLVAGAVGVTTASIRSADNGLLVLLIIGALVGALGGISIGREKSFALKLQAQTALCQVQIEHNTGRLLALLALTAPPAAAAPATPPAPPPSSPPPIPAASGSPR